MSWIYLSPHLDDAVLSCGGFIWQQVQSGTQVEIWTIFAGDPQPPLSDYAQSLHARWQVQLDASEIRRAEDLLACQRLGATARHFLLPDCIYRRSKDSGKPIVNTDDELFQPIHPNETQLVLEIQQLLNASLPKGIDLVSPLTMGGHMDHRLVRAVAEALPGTLHFYSDYPYAAISSTNLNELVPPKWTRLQTPVSEAGLQAWQFAVEAYQSQISTFWQGPEAMKEDLRQYWLNGGGQVLWQRPE